VLVSGVVFKYKGKMPDRPADSNAVEAEAYLSSSPSGDTDISLVLHQLPVVTPEVASRFGTPPADAFTIALNNESIQTSMRLAVAMSAYSSADAVGLAEACGECLAVFAELSQHVLGIVFPQALQAGDMADGPVRGPT